MKKRIQAIALASYAIIMDYLTISILADFERHIDIIDMAIIFLLIIMTIVTLLTSHHLWTREGKEDSRHK